MCRVVRDTFPRLSSVAMRRESLPFPFPVPLAPYARYDPPSCVLGFLERLLGFFNSLFISFLFQSHAWTISPRHTRLEYSRNNPAATDMYTLHGVVQYRKRR